MILQYLTWDFHHWNVSRCSMDAESATLNLGYHDYGVLEKLSTLSSPCEGGVLGGDRSPPALHRPACSMSKPNSSTSTPKKTELSISTPTTTASPAIPGPSSAPPAKSQSASKPKPVNVFSNDGSFLERFQRTKKVIRNLI